MRSTSSPRKRRLAGRPRRDRADYATEASPWRNALAEAIPAEFPPTIRLLSSSISLESARRNQQRALEFEPLAQSARPKQNSLIHQQRLCSCDTLCAKHMRMICSPHDSFARLPFLPVFSRAQPGNSPCSHALPLLCCAEISLTSAT